MTQIKSVNANKAEIIREAAEDMLAAVAEGDPEASHWPEGWLHRYADRLEGFE